VSIFARNWATGVPELLSDGDALYLVGHETLGWTDGATWRYTLPDALGSIRQTVDGVGAVVSAREWSPYGVEVGAAQAGLGYTGEWFDGGTGLVYLRARWYSPGDGIFTSRDPVEGEPPYQYVRGNPVNGRDPSGLVSVGPGFIERQLYNIPALTYDGGRYGGPGLWLEAATALPVVREVYDHTRIRLLAGEYLYRTARDLYRDVWMDSWIELSKASFCGGILPLESTHVSLVVFGKISAVDRHEPRSVFPGGFANLPGYIPNLWATDPRDMQGADTTTHFFLHAFLSFEMLYSDKIEGRWVTWPSNPVESQPATGEQIRMAVDDIALLLGGKLDIINEWYEGYARECGFEDYNSSHPHLRSAYEYAVNIGNVYEIFSTSAFGGTNAQERLWNLVNMSDEEFRQVLRHSNPGEPSGLQDEQVFRDLRANRRGANFGVTAFSYPLAQPFDQPHYNIPPPPR
jgi:RHS repeat-associated protein